MVFDDILEIKNGKNQKAVENPNGKYPIYGSGGAMGYADAYICEADTVIVGRKGSINNPIFVEEPFWNVDTAFGLQAKREVLLPRYLFYFCKFFDFERLNKAVTIPSLTKGDLLKIEIDLPELSRQQEIVNQLLKIEHIIELRKHELSELDNLIKARFVEMFGDAVRNPNRWDTYSLNECFDITSSKRILKSEWKNEGIPFLRVRDMVQLATTGKMDNEFFVSEEFYSSLSDLDGVPKQGDILVSATSTLGKCYIVNRGERFYFKDADVLRFRAKKEVNPTFFVEQMKTRYIEEQIERTLGVTTVAHFTIKAAKTINIRCPNIELQNQFADFVAQVNKSKVAVQKSLEEVQLLFNSLMQEYFG
jgi:type I restriction enzyme S subunit